MPYPIAGIDVHKRMLAVVVADVAVDTEYVFERRIVGTTPDQLRALAAWLVECDVEEVVMESTAQYWRPVWDTLEWQWQPTRRARADASPASGALHLAQAQSNEARRGRKKDFPDAARLVKRLVAAELTLSFVPDMTQRLWRTVTRRKYQLTGNRVQLRTVWSASSKKRTLKCRVWCRICWVPVRDGCCARLRKAKPIPRPSPPSAVRGCMPRQTRCAMRLARAAISTPSTGGSSR